VLALSIAQFDANATREDVEHYAGRLLQGTKRVTEALHGYEPFPHWARPVDGGGRLRTDLATPQAALTALPATAPPPSAPAARGRTRARARATTSTRATSPRKRSA
jgi:hypothetical protein